jgi:hypothetical protein
MGARLSLATCAIMASAAPAVAGTDTIYVGDNHSWALTCNASGYRLQSRHPVARFIEKGADSQVIEGLETLYLGRDCDARHNVLNEGKWCWANGGFVAEFGNTSIGFPRQELSCADGNHEITGCGC